MYEASCTFGNFTNPTLLKDFLQKKTAASKILSLVNCSGNHSLFSISCKHSSLLHHEQLRKYSMAIFFQYWMTFIKLSAYLLYILSLVRLTLQLCSSWKISSKLIDYILCMICWVCPGRCPGEINCFEVRSLFPNNSFDSGFLTQWGNPVFKSERL